MVSAEIKQARSRTGKTALKGGGVGLLAGLLPGGPIGGLAAGAASGAITGKMKDYPKLRDRQSLSSAERFPGAVPADFRE